MQERKVIFMLRIGEFSKLAHMTVKALRFYEKEGLLCPRYVDEENGYRYYDTSQLKEASSILAYRQLGLSIEEIKEAIKGDPRLVLEAKAQKIKEEKMQLESRLSIIQYLLEERDMKYQVIEKKIPSCIVYYSETVLPKYSDCMSWIPSLGAKCMALNPSIKCAEPAYEFMEYLDGEHVESNVHVRHCEAVTSFGTENEEIKFKEIPACKVLSIYHKGVYEQIGEAYAYLYKYAEDNGYTVAGLSRECYIDGIWNKEKVEDWLTEVQLPVSE